MIVPWINRLVDDLGLHSDLGEYKVPKEDVPKIAEKAIGSKDHPIYPKAVKLLEGLYPAWCWLWAFEKIYSVFVDSDVEIVFLFVKTLSGEFKYKCKLSSSIIPNILPIFGWRLSTVLSQNVTRSITYCAELLTGGLTQFKVYQSF